VNPSKRAPARLRFRQSVTALADDEVTALRKVTQRVTVTAPLRHALQESKELAVTIVPVIDPLDAAALPEALVHNLLQFERVNLVAYQ
jgi:hypothetical protein